MWPLIGITLSLIAALFGVPVSDLVRLARVI